MPVYDTKCTGCDKEQEEYKSLSNYDTCTPCTCGGEYRNIIKNAPAVSGASLDGNFTPHYDEQAGRHFQSADEKKHWLKETGKVQTGGSFSPKQANRDQTQRPMTRDQAKKGLSNGSL